MSTDSHRSDEALQLPAAYSEFQNLLLDGPDVATFMQQIVNLASAIVSRPPSVA